ncbi:MAG: hypothetical protein ACYDC2_08150 [Solirubrobacteraceae bacterium]
MATTTSPKPRAKAARKTTARKATTTARKAKVTARKPAKATAGRTASKPTTAAKAAKAKASRAKGARTRAAHQAQATLGATQTATSQTAGVFGDYAERAVLIPVGAALIARDRVVSGVTDTLSSYSSSSKAQAQLRKFERRGNTARKRLEREVRKARVRVERELRLRRKETEKQFKEIIGDIESRRDAITKNGSDITNRVPELANQVQDRILSLV